MSKEVILYRYDFSTVRDVLKADIGDHGEVFLFKSTTIDDKTESCLIYLHERDIDKLVKELGYVKKEG